MDKTGEKESSHAEQTTEYRLVSKLGKNLPRLRQTLLDLFSIDLRTLGSYSSRVCADCAGGPADQVFRFEGLLF